MPKTNLIDARRAELWYQALLKHQTITERLPSARDEIVATRTAPARAPQCKVCGHRLEEHIHNGLLSVHQGKIELAVIALRYSLPAETLQFHLENCMSVNSRGGSHAPFSTDYLIVPDPVKRIRTIKALEIIDRAPCGETNEVTRINSDGLRETRVTTVWGVRERLIDIWFGVHDPNGISSLLRANTAYFRPEAEVRAIAEAVIWFADQVQRHALV
jgi:hypothetical protein